MPAVTRARICRRRARSRYRRCRGCPDVADHHAVFAQDGVEHRRLAHVSDRSAPRAARPRGTLRLLRGSRSTIPSSRSATPSPCVAEMGTPADAQGVETDTSAFPSYPPSVHRDEHRLLCLAQVVGDLIQRRQPSVPSTTSTIRSASSITFRPTDARDERVRLVRAQTAGIHDGELTPVPVGDVRDGRA